MTEHSDESAAPAARPSAAAALRSVDEVHLADAVVTRVLQVPGVARMHGGMFGEVATYLPGRRIVGVQLRDSETVIHVVLFWGVDIVQTVDLIRASVGPLVGTPVDVTVQDVDIAADLA